MPNWASTAYVFKAKDQEQAKDLYEKIDSLSKMTEPLVPNGFGKLWMGCLVNLLGGDWDKVYCRGEIIDYNLTDDHVSIECETAWGDLQRLCPNATLLGNGIRISASASHNAMNIVSEWLESIGLYDPTGIEENHDQTTPNATGVYTIDGRLLQRDDKNTESLKPGVYIINGKKQVITK